MEKEAPRFCAKCGKPLEGKPVCECGYQAGTGPVAASTLAVQTAAPGADAPPVGLWLQLAWQRLLQVLRLEEPTVELPLQAALISMVLRILVIGIVVNLWLKVALTQAVRAMGAAAFLFGGMSPRVGVGPFWWVALSLLVAGAASAGVLYLGVGRSYFHQALTYLSDAQWPLAIGILAAWLLSYLTPSLGMIALVTAIAWGQALLSAGIARLNLPARNRLVLHTLCSLASCVIFFLVLQAVAGDRVGGLF
ncbi:MAG: hypothetical protein K0R39_3882 [Symbiobacteriaceae bacterium]|jgi:hypothetical protein|nr:hypothetical protein [Symbiobacteriaceae bacterium]